MSFSRFRTFRPFKFGDRDRRQFIVQDSEVALRAINDANGCPIFIGRSLVGTATSDPKWQLRKVQYGPNQGAISVTWPQNGDGLASSDYEFIWDTNSNLTITAITQDNPAVVTVSSAGSISNGDSIVITDVSGMTEVNYDGSNIYTVANLSGTQFELSGIDSSAFTAYTSAGEVTYGEVVNYTYS